MKKILLTLLAFMATVAVNAGQVSKHQALQKAQQFMPGKQFGEGRSFARSGNPSEREPFYVFNAEGSQGFVIVSGDDRTTEILGYSTTGSIDLNRLPENLKGWLDGYAREIEALGTSTQPVQRAKTREADSWAAIDPLIKTQWNQSEPYNLMCPDGKFVDYDESGYDTENRCVTGCVATAMAQVIYYWQCQNGCDAIDKYDIYRTVNNGTEENPDWQLVYDHSFHGLGATTFDWESMALTYPSNATGASANAVAKLLRYCGQAVNMDYNLEGSEAALSPYHLAEYFGFRKNARQVKRCYYSEKDWEKMIYQELSAEGHPRPVLYSGSSNSGGHQFIVDGYDGNGLFHMNWGWGGMSDGYYVLSLANADELGAGGGTSKDGYSKDQSAIIGLMEDNGEDEKPQFYAGFYDDLEQNEYTRGSVSEDFTDVSFPGYVYFLYNDPNMSAGTYNCTFRTAWGLYRNGSLLEVLGASDYFTLGNKYVEDNWNPFSFGSNLGDGKYQFRQVYQLDGSSNWQLFETDGVVFVDAVISGNKLTLRKSHESVYSSHVAINAVTFSSTDFEVGKPVEVTVNLTNNGDSFQELICFWVGDKRATLVCGSMESGKTGTVKLHFTPAKSGQTTFCISTDAPGKLSEANVVWSKDVTVSAPKSQSLSGTMVIDNFDDKKDILYGTTLNMTVNVKNEGTNTYDNAIVLNLFKIVPGEEYHPIFKSKSVMANIKPGETKPVVLTISGLNLDDRYFYYVSYSSSGENVPLNLPWTQQAFSLKKEPSGDASGNGSVGPEDITAVVQYILTGDFEGFNFEDADLNHDGKVDATDLVLLIKLI